MDRQTPTVLTECNPWCKCYTHTLFLLLKESQQLLLGLWDLLWFPSPSLAVTVPRLWTDRCMNTLGLTCWASLGRVVWTQDTCKWD